MAATSQDAGPESKEASLTRALSMLVEALQILDDHKVPPEVGARLQGVIDDLTELGPN